MDLYSIVLFVLGIIVGVSATILINLIRTKDGTLNIDSHNPKKDIYRIDINDLDSLSRKKRVILTVNNKANLSQK